MRIDKNLLARDNTWTGSNDFSGTSTFKGSLILNSTDPLITFIDTTGAQNDWTLGASAASFVLRNTDTSLDYLTVTDSGVVTIGNSSTLGITYATSKTVSDHIFKCNTAEKFRVALSAVTASTDVTISKAIPALNFTDSGGDDFLIDVGTTASSLRIRNTTDGRNDFVIDGAGNVAVSTSYAPQNYIKFYAQDRVTDPTVGQRQAFGGTLEIIHSSANWSGGNQYACLFGIYLDSSTKDFNNGSVAYGFNGQGVGVLAAGRTANNLGGIFGTIQVSGAGGTLSNSANYGAFTSITGGVTVTNHKIFNPGSASVGGGSSIGTLTGYSVPVQTAGGTNYEMLFDTTARAYFRDANQYVYSSAANTLDISANTTTLFRVAGTSVAAIASGFMLESKAAGNEATGAGTPLAGTNCPAVTATAPYTWLKFKTSDGSTVYVAAYK